MNFYEFWLNFLIPGYRCSYHLDKLASVASALDPANKKVTIDNNNATLPLTEIQSLYYRLIVGQFDGKVYFNGNEIILNWEDVNNHVKILKKIK